MADKKTTRKAMLSSILSLVICLSMLIGATFAWFTDSVTSSRNIIQSGNLDVELYYSVMDGNGVWRDYEKVTKDTKIFNYDLWEPGYTAVAKFKVVNEGTLALKYQLSADVYEEKAGETKDGADIKLSEILRYGVTEDLSVLGNRAEAVNVATMTFGRLGQMDVTNLAKGAEAEVGMVIAMPTDVGNEANHNGIKIPEIEFGITLVATQETAESDSFNNQYDVDSIMPVSVGPNGAQFTTEEGFTFNIPRAALEDDVTSVVPDMDVIDTEYIWPNDLTTTLKQRMSLDIEITGIKENNTEPVTVSYVVPGYEDYLDVEVYHKGVKVDDATYDAATRTVTFTVTSFSPFEFVFEIGATVIPESYSNEEAIEMLTNAKDGAIIDGHGRTITFADNVANKWSFLIQNGVTFRNMTLKAKGDGSTVMIYGVGKEIKMKNVTFQNTKSGKKAVEISTNSRKSLIFEDCTIKGKPYVQGPNITFTRCSFNTNMNLESATNVTLKDCVFTVSGAITMNSTLANILIEGCEFKYANAIRLYAGMPQPTNVKLINNTYKTTLIKPDSGIDYAGWKDNGAWIEDGNIAK